MEGDRVDVIEMEIDGVGVTEGVMETEEDFEGTGP